MTETRPLSERLRTEARYLEGFAAATYRTIGADCDEAADTLEAQAALLSEVAAFARQFVLAAAEDESIQNNPAFEGDDIAWLVDHARDLLSRIEAVKP